MTIPIYRADESIVIGAIPSHPERTAMVEADGALLLWDELADTIYPAARIFDLDRAGEWLWDIYGAESIRGILTGDEEIDPIAVTSILRTAKRLAHIEWARSWWPESALSSIPPLSTHLLDAEAALHAFAVEHLLDDAESVRRSLSTVDFGQLAEFARHRLLGEEVTELLDRLDDLAEDYGVEPIRTSRPTPVSGLALAAGDMRATSTAAATGKALIDWNLVPAGMIDSAGSARWELARHEGELTLSVSVPAASSTTDVPLTARVGDTDISLERSPDLPFFVGRTVVPTSFLLTRTDQRQPVVHSPVMGRPEDASPELADRHQAILAHARRRLATPDGLLAERIAGA